MVQNKDLKRLVRARMRKTGESYTAARAQIQKKTADPIAPAPQPDLAALGGMSDTVVKAKTGRSWTEWVQALDWHGAAKLPHRRIAQLVSDEFGVGDWWTQMVTVGYERIKGLRARGQRRDGTYEASKSRTVDVPVAKLFKAWADAGARRKWLAQSGVTVRTATSPKSMRLGWEDGSIVAVGFMAKGKAKSAVAVQHTRLPSREAAEQFKKYWAERLAALVEHLNGV